MNPLSQERTNVLSYAYSQPDLRSWIHCFCDHHEMEAKEDSIDYPPHLGSGYAKVRVIEPGLSYRLVHYKLSCDYQFKCEPSADFNLIIYFYQFTSDKKILFEIADNAMESDAKDYRAIVMTNSRIKQKLSLNAGTEVRGLTIQADETWLDKRVNNTSIKNYSLLKKNSFLMDVISAKFQKILNDIFSSHHEAQLPDLYMTTRVLRLLEGFLENILKRDVIEPMLSISSKDFESILKIEGLLLEHYSEVFPKIEKLARIALMSESKLKKIYKQAFGMGLYEYYQKNRMHKAKEMLSTGEYTVTQVGTLLGYHNLSNFSSSFKKEFNKLPKDFQHVG